MSKGQSGHAIQHIRATAIRNQCQLIICTQGFCQIEIVTTVFSIYKVKLWCKLCTMTCERETVWEEISQRYTGEKHTHNSKNILGCWWGVTGVKCIITRRMFVVNFTSSKTDILMTAEDIIMVLLPASLPSCQLPSFSQSTLEHRQR